MKLFFALCAAALLLAGCQTVYATPPPAPIVNGATQAAADVQDKTVALIELRDGDPFVYCSGVWVGPQLVLTANHCDPDDEEGTFIGFALRSDVSDDGEHVVGPGRDAAIVKRDVAHDLLLLRARTVGFSHAFASVSNVDPYVGEFDQTMGHPLGLWWSYSQGVVAAIRRVDVGDFEIDRSMLWVQSTASISPGNSGGGLFDAFGDLIGICSRGITRGQNLNLYVHAQYVRAFLKG